MMQIGYVLINFSIHSMVMYKSANSANIPGQSNFSIHSRLSSSEKVQRFSRVQVLYLITVYIISYFECSQHERIYL